MESLMHITRRISTTEIAYTLYGGSNRVFAEYEEEANGILYLLEANERLRRVIEHYRISEALQLFLVGK